MIPCLNAATAGGGLGLNDFVTLASRNGFRGVEFPIDAAQDMGAEAARDLFASHHVVPATFGLPVEWRGDEAAFEKGMRALPAWAQTARTLGCERCCTFVMPESDTPVAEYAALSKKRLAQVAQVLNEQNLRLGLEFLGPKHFRENASNVWFYNVAGGLEAVEDINRAGGVDNVGLLVDAWHWYTSGGTAMDLASIPERQIVHVHINDAPRLPVDEQRDNVRLLPGQSGVIDARGFLRTLAAIGYSGPVAVETFSEELKNITPDEGAARASAAMRKVFGDADLEF